MYSRLQVLVSLFLISFSVFSGDDNERENIANEVIKNINRLNIDISTQFTNILEGHLNLQGELVEFNDEEKSEILKNVLKLTWVKLNLSKNNLNQSNITSAIESKIEYNLITNKIYNVKKQIGFGCSGTVLLASSSEDKEYAIKAFWNFGKGMDDITTHLVKEAIPLIFPHPSLVNVVGIFRDDMQSTYIRDEMTENWQDTFYCKTMFMVMEKYDSTLSHFNKSDEMEELRNYEEDNNAMLKKEIEILRYFLQILHGIAHLHSNSIYHMDLHMDNILVKNKASGEKTFVVADFGVCQFGNIAAGPFLGSMRYHSPECINSVGTAVDISKNDIWASGCILFELLENRHPFITKNHRKRTSQRPLSEKWSKELNELLYGQILNKYFPCRASINSLIIEVQKLAGRSVEN